jgi:AAA+ superfamily predicted ATPase
MFQKIKLGYPALWVKTVENDRIVDSIVRYDFRHFFFMDPEKGLVQYVDSSWKQILIVLHDDNGASSCKPCYDLVTAFKYVEDYSKDSSVQSSFIFPIIGKTDQFFQTYSVYVSVLNSRYRKMFWNDQLDSLVQLIVLSSYDLPEECSHLFTAVDQQVPTREDLYHVIDHIDKSSHGRFLDRDSLNDVLASGLGLSEADFVAYCLESVVSTGKINSKFIYDHKMKTIKQRGILEICKPTISFDDIGGLDNIKDLIRRTSYLWSNRELSKSFGVVPIRRILMVGVPGTGKSAICQATARELGLDLARTGISQVMNSFVGQSEANMRSVFAQIRAMTPLCVWIDEFGRDLSGGASSSVVDAGTTDRVHAAFLTGLQELPEDAFLMCAANQLDSLRPEMLRADRFDKIVFVGLPSFSERRDIFKIYLREINTDHQYDYEALANATDYFTGAEIYSLVKETKFYVVSEDLRAITTQDILSVASNVRNIIWNKNKDMIRTMYQYAMDNWDWASKEQYEYAKLVLTGKTSSQEIAWKI